MYHYFQAISDIHGDALPGFYVRAVDPVSGNALTLYSDTSLTAIETVSGLANAALVDGDGNVDFYVTQDTANLDIYAPDGVTLIKAIPNVSMGGALFAGSASVAVNVKSFGAVADGVTDDSPAFIAAIAYLKSIASNSANNGIYLASPKLFIPAGKYLCNQTLDITHTLIIEGEGGQGFGAGGGASTIIMFPAATTGIRIQAYDTANATDVVASHVSGGYTTIRDLYIGGPAASNNGLLSGTGLLEGEYHGVHVKAIVEMFNVQVEGFQGDALYEHTTIGGGSPDEGQSNLSRFYNCVFRNSRNGASIAGGDSNAQVFTGCQFLYNRACGVDDGSFLSNSYIHPHAAGNGISHDNDGSANFPAYVVSNGGNRYCPVQGQEATASTTAPSGTADTSVWLYLGAGGAIAGIPAWTSGISLRCGAPYRTSNINAPNHFYNPYSEGGQGFSQFKSPTVCHGGLHGSGGPKGTGVLVQNIGGSYVTRGPIGSFDSGGHGMVVSNPALSSFYQQITDGTNNITLTPSGGDIAMTEANSTTQTDWFYALLGEGTSNPVGKRRIGFPNGFGVASKKWFPGTAAPVTGAYNVGDMVWNTAPAASGNIGWVCTTAGSPGTWKTFGSISA